MNIKKLLTTLAILFQIISVASIAITKESILLSGKQITLQTAPIDPRDIFKGDYVKLKYNLSSIPVHQLEKEIKKHGLKKGQKVYLTITTDQYGLGHAEKLYLNPPDNNIYLTGHVTSHWPYKNYQPDSEDDFNKNKQPVSMKFGIEQYYVEQGQGKVMENILGKRDDFQQPMLVKVAVAENGNSVVHSFDWANIAMKTEVLRSAQRNGPDNLLNATVRFSLKNKHTKSITLPLKDNDCSFVLVPTFGNPLLKQKKGNFFNRPECEEIDSQSKTLKPNETITVDFDLNQAQWLVDYKNNPTALSKLPWEYRYRIIYKGKSIEGINANIVSNAFHGRGNID
ncbi:MAG: GDYXXLXY domain-containing protein [Gammaproteobacteria bacterium]|jgi:uncharacterized membrane-anchored protein|nr:GDYXXLXY domain-containing protein [Gammaproteobacteria bacterium]MBT3724331.1 GDYXXLXY domain-containing protein [Gammaproteobacteria bacterium]MBT4074980.1 GDYXXLXY domain-containing protein [Gammaproteobacteria bacterium]MBT4193594.1 GDYXXLXY domain-containing protein [Gammaproteobacteria bacterium]MBT4452035.1 GDYXXLXY domain-containing protein [Gammaproteobacteria bacterium]